jgi:geranylgeranyl pyrophosphate synthase
LEAAEARLEEIGSAVAADVRRLLPTSFDDPALRRGLDAALRRQDLTLPPMQIARLVYGAILGREAPLRLTTLTALVNLGAGLHDDVSDGDVTGGRAEQAEALLLSGVCLATLAPFALTTLVEPARAVRALQLLWSGLQAMAGGQRRDLALFDDERPDLRAAESALAKTTGECGMYAAFGAVVAGVTDEAELARWEAFGADVGYVLQLGSDCQDVVDPRGRDIRSGARTLAIAFALHDVDGATYERLCAALRKARRDAVAAREARELIIATRTLTACGTLAEARVARAERHLTELGPSYPAALQAFVAELSWLRK